MMTALFRRVGLLFVLVNYFCKGEARLCSCAQLADIIAEIRKEVLDAINNQTKAITKTQCPVTWIGFQGSCYFFSKARADFYEAEVICSKGGAHLVLVQSEEENTFLKSHLRELKGSFYWMGLTDSFEEGVWLSYDTDVPTSFTDWGPGEPSNQGGNENCAGFYRAKHYAWNDGHCVTADHFICEKELT